MIYSENYCWKGPACSHSRFLIVILLMSDMNEQVTKFCFGDSVIGSIPWNLWFVDRGSKAMSIWTSS